MKKYFYIGIIGLLLISCTQKRKSFSPDEYLQWIKSSEKELVKVKEIKGYIFKAKLQPVELLILRSAEGSLTQGYIDSTKQIHSGIINIVMDIGSTDGQQSLLRAHIQTEEEYFKRVYYYTSEVQKDLYVLEGQDTLPCKFYHFEQTFNLSPVNSLVMEFERKDPTSPYKDVSFVYEDRILNVGIIKFLYKKSFLNQLPELKAL